ncbi:hypothetical protein QYE76_016824 [Lolium multiflorum]|uniref:Uncharacterized protein n=1 Tax=Lolium multiflorum TaxID=4521 RepID=A0AAD8Q8P5_LOLMU|nr:hypothetical protein QYE76_016824 [Lolium multiflorum]
MKFLPSGGSFLLCLLCTTFFKESLTRRAGKLRLASHQSRSTSNPQSQAAGRPHRRCRFSAAATGLGQGEGVRSISARFYHHEFSIQISVLKTEAPNVMSLPQAILPCLWISSLKYEEDGVILDFAGPNFVSVDNFAFGAVARYIQVNGDERYKLLGTQVEATWDDALKKGVQEFQNRSYNLFTCNCHSFVANNLNRLFYSGHDKWNVVSLAAVMFLRGRWVSTASVVKTFAPFAVVLTLGGLLGGMTFLVGLLAFAAAMTGWFLVGTYCIKSLIEL